MSRRSVAPLLLLLAAAASIAAIFAVHQIERGDGPLAEPWASHAFAPGVKDAKIRFATRRPERITITVTDPDGRVVRTLLSDEPVDGPRIEFWNGRDDAGTIVDDGAYRIEITRDGDPRVYAPTRSILVDSLPPVAQLMRAVVVDGTLNGRALIVPPAKIRVFDADGEPLGGLRAWRRAGDPTPADAPTGARPIRFSVGVSKRVGMIDDLRIVAVDAAGNQLDLLALDDAPMIEVRP
ncbi:MAG: FlgD immunoglobulin-like domain containing protein [Gaiellales bacterium]